MGFARFYHLTQEPLEAALPKLLSRALQAGMKIDVRCTSPDRLTWLDEKLWLGDDTGFLPHGMSGGPHDAEQPVLLTASETTRTDATCLIGVDGAPVSVSEIEALDRVLILFDGGDAGALNHARGQWKSLTENGATAEYWSQESGRWELKAKSQ